MQFCLCKIYTVYSYADNYEEEMHGYSDVVMLQ